MDTKNTPPADVKPAKSLQVRCPSCGEKHIYSTENPYRPFCSKGCKAIDLGAWASEQYRVEAKPTTEDHPDDPEA
jgi:endogenous inhibitor of DNA gyrase (YacG/DUF329 family)